MPDSRIDPQDANDSVLLQPDEIADAASLAPEQQIPADSVAVPVDTHAPLVGGSLWKAIWTMSWPLMITTIGTSIVGTVDVQVSGIIGSSAQAAVGLAEQVIFIFFVFLMSVGVGTTAIVSRAYGENDRAAADHSTGQSLSLAVLMGIALSLLALATAHWLLPVFSKSPNVVSQGDMYLSVFSLYVVPFSIVCISNSALRAIGDARVTVFIVLTEVIINIVGDYLTVLGHWPVPGLGIRGIAGSAVAGALAAALVAVICIGRSSLKGSLDKLLPVSLTAVKRVLHVGVPSAFQRLSWAASTFVLFFILSRVSDPTAALASWTIGMRVEGMLFMPLMALSLAVSSIVGQNLGAGQVDRAKRAGWHVTNIGMVMMVLLASLMFVFAIQLARVMSHDPQTIEYTASYLRWNALSEPLLAVNMILSGALQGAGDTRVPMWASIFSNWAIRLPLAWVLVVIMGWGPTGAWISMSVSVVISALIIAVRFQTGGWVKLKV